MRKMLLAAIAGLLLHGDAAAADASGTYTIKGQGASSCGVWVENRRKDSWATLIDQTWIRGYLTAYNHYVYQGKDVSAGTDRLGVAGWVDKYCREHPIKTINDAAGELILFLEKRR